MANARLSSCARIVVISLTVFGFVCLVVGGVVFGVFPSIFSKKVEESLVLKSGSEAAERFINPPVPTTMQFTLFNCTNMEEVNNDVSVRPILEEIGPFVYNQIKNKNVSKWDSETGTVTYKEDTTMEYDKSRSTDISLDAEINHYNLPKLALSPLFNLIKKHVEKAQEEDPVGQKRPDITIEMLGEPIVTHKIGELLFDGYVIPVLKFLHDFYPEVPKQLELLGPLPHENKFGIFYKKKQKIEELKSYEVYTGESGIEKYTYIKKFDGKESLNCWTPKTHCEAINGTDGTQYPPNVEADSLYVFSADVSRSLLFEYQGTDVKIHDIEARRFVIPNSVFADPNTDYDNSCFCIKDRACPKAGVIPLRSCTSDPVAMSAPHFYQGDESYQNAFVGLKPDKAKHETFIDVEPLTGTVIRGRKRLQINAETRTIIENGKNYYANDSFFPVLWLQEGAEISEAKAKEFRDQVINPKKTAEWSLIAVMAIGAVVILLGIAIYFMKR